MSKVFDLESFREELDREFAPLVFKAGEQTYVLQSLLRVPTRRREAVLEAMKVFKSDNEDGPEGEKKEEVELDLADADMDQSAVLSALKTILSSVVEGSDEKGHHFVGLFGEDLAAHMKMMKMWQEATQPGEAQDSPS